MREIKFRAFSKKLNRFVNVGKHFDISNTTEHSESSVYQGVVLDEDVGELELMQFTGLKDKNDKEIWEGDIIKNDRGFIHRIVWCELGYWGTKPLDFQYAQPLWINHEGIFEVIGNIYENKELLNSGEQK